jgi:hypothetical protein
MCPISWWVLGNATVFLKEKEAQMPLQFINSSFALSLGLAQLTYSFAEILAVYKGLFWRIFQ